jgi:hypothetical protein
VASTRRARAHCRRRSLEKVKQAACAEKCGPARKGSRPQAALAGLPYYTEWRPNAAHLCDTSRIVLQNFNHATQPGANRVEPGLRDMETSLLRNLESVLGTGLFPIATNAWKTKAALIVPPLRFQVGTRMEHTLALQHTIRGHSLKMPLVPILVNVSRCRFQLQRCHQRRRSRIHRLQSDARANYMRHSPLLCYRSECSRFNWSCAKGRNTEKRGTDTLVRQSGSGVATLVRRWHASLVGWLF